MMTLESRLTAVVALLPAQEQPRFSAPFTLGESADSRLVEAVRSRQSRGTRLHDAWQVVEYFRAEEIVLHSLLDLGNMEAIKELVKLGLGVSILAPWTARKELREKSLVALPLGRRKLKRRWGVLHWRGRRLNLAEETFIGLCVTVTERMSG